jgi:flavin-binding protein dodecin
MASLLPAVVDEEKPVPKAQTDQSCCGPSRRRRIRLKERREIMSVARVIEISSTSEQSFEDAIQKGITRAASTLRNVQGAWIKEQEVRVEGDRITSYKVNLLITFLLEEGDQGSA